ncbi:MAG: glycosyltransferase family 39 protein [Candidatus Brocadiia bacterium]
MNKGLYRLWLRIVFGTENLPRSENGQTPGCHQYWYYASSLAILVGLLLRLIHYLRNCSLWLDESKLALNLVWQPFMRLLGPLAYHQSAPVGFLWTEKVIVKLLGGSELALRLIPFLAGVASLLLIGKLAIKYCGPRASFFAISLFAIVPSLINYSAEVKQYSTDVLVSILILLSYERLIKKTPFWASRIYPLLLGCAAIFFSHPAVFMLAGLGLAALLYHTERKNWRACAEMCGIGLIWIVLIGLNYWLFLKRFTHRQDLLDYWGEGFPAFKSVPATAEWIRSSLTDVFERTMDLDLAFASVLVFLIGTYRGIKDSKRSRAAALLLPWFFCLIAASMHLYPFKGRLILFLIPSVVIFTGKGLAVMLPGGKNKILTAAGIIAICLVYGGAIGTMLDDGIDGAEDEMLRPVFRHISQNDTGEDILYLYPYCSPQFRYYETVYNFGVEAEMIIPRKSARHRQRLRKYLRDNKRVWVVYPDDREDMRPIVEKAHQGAGNMHHHFQAGNSGTYLLVPQQN